MCVLSEFVMQMCKIAVDRTFKEKCRHNPFVASLM